MTYSFSSPVVATTSIILCFNKHQLTQVHLENGHYNGQRESGYYVAYSLACVCADDMTLAHAQALIYVIFMQTSGNHHLTTLLIKLFLCKFDF